MNYKIINNEAVLDKFIDWLPELGEDEVYYLQLFGRKKYLEAGTIQNGHNSLHRFVCKKHNIKNRIQRLETAVGTYLNRDVPLPQECLALYIIPNPRSQEKAAKNLLKKLADVVTKPYEKYNVHQLSLTELHKACSRKVFVDFDYDDKDLGETLKKAGEFINPDALSYLRTRGGFHLLVEVSKVQEEFRHKWHRGLCSLGADVKGDDLIPIPGCLQGGYEVPMLEPLIGLNVTYLGGTPQEFELKIEGPGPETGCRVFNFPPIPVIPETEFEINNDKS